MSEESYPGLEETVSIHDRDFQRHSIEKRIYCVPIDETEEDRLIDQHEILYEYFEQRLFFPPVDQPEDILDCGCGPASWAAHVAREFADCEVTGLDIFIPPSAETEGNLRFLQWDLNHPFRTSSLRPESFDLVHSRLVAPGIDSGRWVEYVSDLVKLSKRGGWVQLAEFDYIFQSDSGLREEMPALNTWVENYRRVMEDLGRDPRIGRSLQNVLRTANLVEIQSFPRNIPIGGWPTELATPEEM
ncbi:hypothetical protein B0A49_11748 [Cryomyces minteri]|uniref:Methyltransferase domain-containing protein n=1 Tax=Cryomyces minteri TaxID=331657 RepID=A0A4U0WIF3_9PEZI|nr:hypothetical protein B0A49_11748 [Cryomyces minteri]